MDKSDVDTVFPPVDDSSVLNRNRSFKSKQLVRSQAIRETQSPPRTMSPAVAAGESAPEATVAVDTTTVTVADTANNVADSFESRALRETATVDSSHSIKCGDDYVNSDDFNDCKVKQQPVEIQITSGNWDQESQNEQRQRTKRWLGQRDPSEPSPDLLSNNPRVTCVCGNCSSCPHCRGRRRRNYCPTKQDSGIVCSDECPDCSDGETPGPNSDVNKSASVDADEQNYYCRCPEKKDKPKNITLSRTDSDDKSEPTGPELVNFIKDTLNKNSKDRVTLLKIEKELYAFVNDTRRCIVRFPVMTSYGRMLVHRCASLFQLSHHLDQSSKTNVMVSKGGTSGGRIPCTSFRKWCTVNFPPSPQRYQPDCTNARFILKRDAHSLDEPSLGSIPSNRSKSLEQREREYERVRRRIFSTDNCSQDESQWPWMSGPIKLLTSDAGRNKLLKVQSLESSSPTTGGGGRARGAVSKSHSFSGRAPDTPPSRLLSRHGDLASSSWRLSPSSSGYKTLSFRSTDSVTPSPTGGASPEPTLSGVGTESVVWAVSKLSSVPAGAVVLHPQTGRPLMNPDGSLYLFDPAHPPVIYDVGCKEDDYAVRLDIMHSLHQLVVEQQHSDELVDDSEKKRGRLEKQHSFIDDDCECQPTDDYRSKCCPECRKHDSCQPKTTIDKETNTKPEMPSENQSEAAPSEQVNHGPLNDSPVNHNQSCDTLPNYGPPVNCNPPNDSQTNRGPPANYSPPNGSQTNRGPPVNYSPSNDSQNNRGPPANYSPPNDSQTNRGPPVNYSPANDSQTNRGPQVNYSAPNDSQINRGLPVNYSPPNDSQTNRGPPVNYSPPNDSQTNRGPPVNYSPPNDSHTNRDPPVNYSPPNDSHTNRGPPVNYNLPNDSHTNRGPPVNYSPPNDSQTNRGTPSNYSPPNDSQTNRGTPVNYSPPNDMQANRGPLINYSPPNDALTNRSSPAFQSTSSDTLTYHSPLSNAPTTHTSPISHSTPSDALINRGPQVNRNLSHNMPNNRGATFEMTTNQNDAEDTCTYLSTNQTLLEYEQQNDQRAVEMQRSFETVTEPSNHRRVNDDRPSNLVCQEVHDHHQYEDPYAHGYSLEEVTSAQVAGHYMQPDMSTVPSNVAKVTPIAMADPNTRPVSLSNMLYPGAVPQAYPYVNQCRIDPALQSAMYQGMMPMEEPNKMTPSPHAQDNTFRIDPSYPYGTIEYAAPCGACVDTNSLQHQHRSYSVPYNQMEMQPVLQPTYPIGNVLVPQPHLQPYPYQDPVPWTSVQPNVATAPKLLVPDMYPLVQYPTPYPQYNLMYPQVIPQPYPVCQPVYPVVDKQLDQQNRAAFRPRPKPDSCGPTPLRTSPDAGLRKDPPPPRKQENSEIAVKIQQIKDQMAQLNTKDKEKERKREDWKREDCKRDDWKRRSSNGILGSYPANHYHDRSYGRTANDDSRLSSEARVIVNSIRNMQSKSTYQNEGRAPPSRSPRGRGFRDDFNPRHSTPDWQYNRSRPMHPLSTGVYRPPYLFRQMSPNAWCRRSPGPVHPVINNPRRPYPDSRNGGRR